MPCGPVHVGPGVQPVELYALEGWTPPLYAQAAKYQFSRYFGSPLFAMIPAV